MHVNAISLRKFIFFDLVFSRFLIIKRNRLLSDITKSIKASGYLLIIACFYDIISVKSNNISDNKVANKEKTIFI